MKASAAYALLVCLVALVLLASLGQRASAQEGPVVMIGADRQTCENGMCKWETGFGNGVIVEARSDSMVVLTAGHNVHQGRRVKVQLNDIWHPATSFHSSYGDGQPDIAVVIVEGDFAYAPSLRIHQGDIPFGAPVEVHGYWPDQPKWKWRILRPLRQQHPRYGDILNRAIIPGLSGAPVIYEGRVAGIATANDRNILPIPTVTFFTPVTELRKSLQQWGITIKEHTPPAKRLVEDQIADLGEPAPFDDRPVPGSPVPESPSPVDTPWTGEGLPLPPVKPADQEGSERAGQGSPLRDWGLDRLSSAAWAAIGIGVGGPAGMLIPLAWSRLRKKRGGDPGLQHRVKPVRSTDVGRERIVDISDQTRREYEAKIAELESRQTVEYRDINTDHGLRMMREAMRRVGDTYPQSLRWMKTAEAVYEQIMNGAKV